MSILGKSIRQVLAMVLAIVLVLGMVPATALAAGISSVGVSGVGDEVVYNLGSQEITVGSNAEKADSNPWRYRLFDNSGNYCIVLENDAFFPYEVQFTVGNDVVTQWFETPTSTVTVAGHGFTVTSKQTDSTKLTQIGMWMGDQYVAAYPDPKTFVNTSVQPRSLLPLTSKNVTVDLTQYNYIQLQKTKVSTIISNFDPAQDIGSDAKVVWKSYSNDDMQISTQDDYIDLARMSGTWAYLDMIVGSALQLDPTNTRYTVRVQKQDVGIINDVSVYKSVGEQRSKVTPLNTDSGLYSGGRVNEYLDNYISREDMAADMLYIGITLNPSYADMGNIKVYLNSYDSIAAAEDAAAARPELDVTAKVLNQDMSQPQAGVPVKLYPGQEYSNRQLTFVFETDGGKIMHGARISMRYDSWIYLSNIRAADGTYIGYSHSSSQTKDGVDWITAELRPEYPVTDQYRLMLNYHFMGTSNASTHDKITKAVLGHFETEQEAAAAPDLKNKLFTANPNAEGAGYLDRFDGEGKKFTIFTQDGNVHKIVFTLKQGAAQQVNSSTYFQLTGANRLYKTYTLDGAHDSYVEMGYQTVLYADDDVGLSELQPTFTASEEADIHAAQGGGAGTKQESGISVVDFSNGPVQYAAVGKDGKNLSNYWATFVKKHIGGAKLFVNGINGPDGAKREVFLTSATGTTHNIFIANVGDDQLTGLTATLTGAQNIKLDDYWTVGGANNDTLAAFDADRSSGLANNVAKIGIVPDGDSEGEIKGTLTLSADGQQDVVITLTGSVGDPRLTTTDIPKAVKYVPYSVQILHNNKYSWNKVTLSVEDGDLPNGITLKPNGELYGVPSETGIFNFNVLMTNSDSRFHDSRASYTLEVLENTTTNVDAVTDMGYELTTKIGTQSGKENVVTSISDYLFVSSGELGEFMGLWLNGSLLTEDTDYKKESGSTKITVLGQTFDDKANKDGTNTISAEFRVDGDESKELKRASQNFIVKIGNSGNNSSDDNTSNQDSKIADINSAATGSIVTVNMGSSSRVSPSVLNSMIGKDVTTHFVFTNYTWTINGKDVGKIPTDRIWYDLGVKQISLVNLSSLAGGKDVMQLELAHNGAFPFKGALTINVRDGYNGKTLYRYYYNPNTLQLEYRSSEQVRDNTISMQFNSASQYVLTSQPLGQPVNPETGGFSQIGQAIGMGTWENAFRLQSYLKTFINKWFLVF